MIPISYAQGPACHQASVTGSVCDNLVSDFIFFNTPPWSDGTTLAPGCSLGCQQCRVTAGTVQLLWVLARGLPCMIALTKNRYWPPTKTLWTNGTFSALPMDETRIVTSVGYGTTFTSPTVYIVFDSLYASDSCTQVGDRTYHSQIVAVTDPSTLSSLYS